MTSCVDYPSGVTVSCPLAAGWIFFACRRKLYNFANVFEVRSQVHTLFLPNFDYQPGKSSSNLYTPKIKTVRLGLHVTVPWIQ